ncbi:hypothetical protein N7501_000612 [Penicillium viridicatum]|nr:hypothetical protein N7501_000612 [Penicillium viridicatum]
MSANPSDNSRPVRVAHCSGYERDPAYEMYRQATGDVDFITGDYLAGALDMRTAVSRPFLAYYSAIVKQDGLNEEINFVNGPDSIISFPTGHPSAYKALQSRASYNHSPSSDEVALLQSPTRSIPLADIALARSRSKF